MLGVNTMHMYMLFCFFKLFPLGCIELMEFIQSIHTARIYTYVVECLTWWYLSLHLAR